MLNVYESVDANKRKSALIIVFFILFIVLASYFISRGLAAYYGYYSSGLELTGIALVISGLLSFASYYWSDKIILGLSGARPADKRKDFIFYSVTENLALAAGLPMPRLYIIEDTAMNAFATGRDPAHAVVCATTGILTKLERRELEGVIAHELSHIKNFDTRLMAVVAVLVGTVAFLADMFLRNLWWGRGRDRDEDRGLGQIMLVVGIVLAIVTPIIATLIQLAVSRRREFLADASAADLTRHPEGLAR